MLSSFLVRLSCGVLVLYFLLTGPVVVNRQYVHIACLFQVSRMNSKLVDKDVFLAISITLVLVVRLLSYVLHVLV